MCECLCIYVCGGAAASTAELNFHNCLAAVVIVFVAAYLCLLHFQTQSKLNLFQPSRVNHEELLSHCEVVFAPLFLWMLNVMVVLLLLLLLLLLCFFVLYDWPTDWPSRRYSSIAAPAKTGLATNIASAVHLCVVCVCVCMCAIVSINRDFMRSLHSRAQRSADIAAVANLSVHMYVYR